MINKNGRLIFTGNLRNSGVVALKFIINSVKCTINSVERTLSQIRNLAWANRILIVVLPGAIMPPLSY